MTVVLKFTLQIDTVYIFEHIGIKNLLPPPFRANFKLRL